MRNRFTHHTIKPEQGGALINVTSLDTVGAANYSQKVNMRREVDREVRREGWEYFFPIANPTEPQPFQYLPGFGDPVPPSALLSLVGWVTQETWYTTQGPVVGPEVIHALPATGSTPITAIAQCVQANGERITIAAMVDTIYRFDEAAGVWIVIGSGYSTSGKRWELVAVNGETVFNNGIDLPFTVSVQHPYARPIQELRERGVSRVGTIAEYYGFLHCFDVTEIKPEELNAWMNGPTPYGIVPDGSCNRIRQRHIWSEFGKPRNWAPVFTVTINAVTSTIQLPFPSSVFIAGETRVAVDGAGISGGVLGGETGYEEGVLVTAVAGIQVSLEKETSAGITYPRTARVMRFADTSSIVGYSDMTDDGSAIIKALALRDVFVVYRDTGIFVGRYTAVLEQPFAFKRVYNGLNVPYFPDTVIEVQGAGHLYAGAGRFFLFDGIDEPKIFSILDLARKEFFASITGSPSGMRNSAFSVLQPQTREIWFCTPSRTLTYNFESKTCDEIDTGITAAAIIVKPGTVDELMFALANVRVATTSTMGTPAVGTTKTYSVLAQYGGTYRRYGIDSIYINRGLLSSGLWSMGDDFNEKAIRSYCIQLASGQPSTGWSITVSLYGRNEASELSRLLFTRTVTPPDFVNGRLMLPVFFQATFFQDHLQITGASDVQIVARTIEVAKDNSRGIGKTRQ